MNKALLTVVMYMVAFFPGRGLAKNEKYYPADSIDKDLRKYADAVVRNYDLDVYIDDEGKTVTVTTTFVVTVLNEHGRKQGDFSGHYSSFEGGLKLEGAVYDAGGKLLTRIKKSDFSARNASPYYGHYDDVKVWEYKVAGRQYPYTVMYTSESTADHTFFLPGFDPQPSLNCAVEKASFRVEAPAWFKIKYKHYGYGEEYPGITDREGNKEYRWETAGLKARKEEPLEYQREHSKGGVLITPVEFGLDEYKGGARSWEEFSSFVYKLNENKEDLPDSIKGKVPVITKGITDTFDKIQALYKFMQDNTRYVAIEYGISGWQTMPASYTAEKQYGDCKALSYYMKALLKEAGIASNAVLVYAGRENSQEVVEELPGPQFNHVILQVPLKEDTVWLECTSSELPAGFLGNFTQNRKVLVLSEKGGKIVRTPGYDTAYNKIYRHVTARCNENGSMTYSINNLYCGESAVEMYLATQDKNAAEIDRYASGKFSLQSYTVSNPAYKRLPVKRNIVMGETLDIQANGMVSRTGKYTVLNYNLLPLSLPEINETGERHMSFQISTSSQTVDSFTIDIPAGLSIAGMPEVVEEMQIFGYYSRRVLVNGTRVTVVRKMAEFQGVYEPELFTTYVQWLDKIRRDGTGHLMLSGD